MKLIDKDALIAEIERLIEINKVFKNSWKWKFKWFYRTIIGRLEVLEGLKNFIDTLEVKEVDLDKELGVLDNAYFEFNGVMVKGTTIVEELKVIAKHFFELGLKAQHSSIGIPNIDDIFEEEGVDPNSKDAKIFKECYYMALEKLKAQKGKEV